MHRAMPYAIIISPLTGAVSFILLTAKVYTKPVFKIFAFTVCGYAFFLLSANIYQATFSVRKGLCLKSLKLILNWDSNPDLALRHEGSCVKKTRILPENSGQKLSELERRVFLAATIIRVFS